ncbi:hypothetical protein [Coxiella burnetii]|uniref:Uncharacterized protein n=1 Tax=Coxiella burnetii (strain RSA 493 / Nine Mile phase I) TaxID=227377 RepID=Q83E82_COXBU|nr:hypothetical protein [Coxiella burnetii]NP_819483.1 hypothetical protein CBU_0446 [Coxiella burnetii RSA 493]AAO89997.1 hypothetical protein CBU_0446 [Coxiella burnetii RSA 493]ABX77863.1 hypothetical protein COXBURSA331_A0553 [Coxiella burnetii RSA 331]ACJ18859.1 hypothetical protein CbuG_1565 [Coxiella burnetii CbuG_Q212]AML48764.1 hypothetical protein AUR58_05920 [Coxiella burnetii]AML54734.1 hypothetical protein AYM38_05250 [Coxiella burnetii]
MYSPAWPHSEVKEIFPNIFFVTGTNITHHDNTELQHSRNMIIIRDNGKLSLINTVRLNDKELAFLDALGEVNNVIRIGAFHGRDDAFYLDRYHAKLWALKEMSHENNRVADVKLIPNGQMPVPNCSIFIFETSKYPEGILHIAQQNGILITCDSIKNWLAPDTFFSTETATLYQEQGFFGAASISTVWKQACNVSSSDFERLKTLKFRHLLSAHGEPLLNNAYELVAKTIRKEYGI